MKAAQPFILMTEHIGSEKLATLLEIRPFLIEHSIVKGNAAEDDLEKKAVKRAGYAMLNVFLGETPFILSKIGRTMNPWTRLAPTTQTT